ncbi:hypothetical protein F5883DRAFT_644990 [Diaporthe sp. PMI_573]|nr:hypothetical protein F5883DRAFT_644990 [Diaporthaceae sp. PMI_573]
MKSLQITVLAALATAIHGWKLQWYAGININCQVRDSFDNFIVRVWEGQCADDAVACNPSSGSNFSIPTKCHDDIHNDGVVTSTEDCDRGIGRGSALVVNGCCQFFGFQDGCSGLPYLELAEGECQDPIQIDNFTCSDDC